MPTPEKWTATWQVLAVQITPALHHAYDDLIARYSEPHRKYHTVRHLDECFTKLDEIRGVAERAGEVEAALWFHDAVYEIGSSENEAKSADLAAEIVRTAGRPADSVTRISGLIMATRHAAAPEGTDARVVVDVDLSILGASPERFDEYERQVREEYSPVPDALFKWERRKIIEEFLARPAIFNTERFRDCYEGQARANLRRSLDHLSG